MHFTFQIVASFTSILAVLGERQVVCNTDSQICGNSCYSPDVYDCVSGNVLCPKRQTKKEICGSRCYDPDVEDCQENYVCSKGQLPCFMQGWNTKCYDPTTSHCTNSDTTAEGYICPLHLKGCGRACFDPKNETCAGIGMLEEGRICAIGEKSCSYAGCYLPGGTKKCIGKHGKILCELNEESCSYNCYSPDSGKVCHDDRALCTPQERSCVGLCFNPKKRHCINDTVLCDIGREACGRTSCYSKSEETCYENRGRYDPISCTIGQLPCGFECFDPKKQVCLDFDYYGPGRQMACPIGSQVCGRSCYEVPNKKFKCVGRQLCPKAEAVCGGRCYEPNSTKVCLNDTLCVPGEELCGNRCFNPKRGKCVTFPN